MIVGARGHKHIAHGLLFHSLVGYYTLAMLGIYAGGPYGLVRVQGQLVHVHTHLPFVRHRLSAVRAIEDGTLAYQTQAVRGVDVYL